MVIVLLVVGIILATAWAPRLKAQEKPRTDAEIMTVLDKCVTEQKRSPGIVVAVIDEKGAKVFSKGVCENGKDAPVNGDSVFEIGSVSKTFTALLLQEMVDDGEVSLDDPISKYLPKTVQAPTRNGREITLVDLATQTSGLPRMPDNFNPKDGSNPYADYTVEQMYDFISHYQLTRDIGAEYEYSNLGVGLLGHILALRAGTSYEALLVRRICDPLGMNSTRITFSPEMKARLAFGHDGQGGQVSNWDIPTLAGAGAIRSTVNDMIKYVAANAGLSNSPLYKAMAATHTPRHSAGTGRKIGLAWHIQTKSGTTWHNGGTGGYHSYIGFKKDPARAVVVLANTANSIDDIGQYLLGDRSDIEEFKPAKTRSVVKLEPRILDGCVGEFKFQGVAATITVTREDNHLFAQMTGQQRFEIFPESETDFFYKVVDAQLTFVKDAKGAATQVILHQNGRDQKLTKVQ